MLCSLGAELPALNVPEPEIHCTCTLDLLGVGSSKGKRDLGKRMSWEGRVAEKETYGAGSLIYAPIQVPTQTYGLSPHTGPHP